LSSTLTRDYEVATRDIYWLRSEKKQERLRYEDKQSKTAKLVDMFEILEEESCSTVKATSKVYRVS